MAYIPESPMDRLLKQIQAAQGIKELFSPSAEQRRADERASERRFYRDEAMMNRYLDKAETTYDNVELGDSYTQYKKYYDDNWETMDENLAVLWEDGASQFRKYHAKNEAWDTHVGEFEKVHKANFEKGYEDYYNASRYDVNGTVPKELYDSTNSMYIKSLAPYITNGVLDLTQVPDNQTLQAINKEIKSGVNQLKQHYKNNIVDSSKEYVNWLNTTVTEYGGRYSEEMAAPWTGFKEATIGALTQINEDNLFTEDEYKSIVSGITYNDKQYIDELQLKEDNKKKMDTDYLVQGDDGLIALSSQYNMVTNYLEMIDDGIIEEGMTIPENIVGYINVPEDTKLTADNKDQFKYDLMQQQVSLENRMKLKNRGYYSLHGDSFFSGVQGYLDTSIPTVSEFLDELTNDLYSNLGSNNPASNNPNSQNNITYNKGQNNNNQIKQMSGGVNVSNLVNLPSNHQGYMNNITNTLVANGVATVDGDSLVYNNKFEGGVIDDLINNVNTNFNTYKNLSDSTLATYNTLDLPFKFQHNNEDDKMFIERTSAYTPDSLFTFSNNYLNNYNGALSFNILNPTASVQPWAMNDYAQDSYENSWYYENLGDDDSKGHPLNSYEQDYKNIKLTGDGSSVSQNTISSFENDLAKIPDIVSQKIYNEINNGELSGTNLKINIDEIISESSKLEEQKNEILNNIYTKLEAYKNTNPEFEEKYNKYIDEYIESQIQIFEDNNKQDKYGDFTVPYGMLGAGETFPSKAAYIRELANQLITTTDVPTPVIGMKESVKQLLGTSRLANSWFAQQSQSVWNNHGEKPSGWEEQFGHVLRNIITLGYYTDPYNEEIFENHNQIAEKLGLPVFEYGPIKGYHVPTNWVHLEDQPYHGFDLGLSSKRDEDEFLRDRLDESWLTAPYRGDTKKAIRDNLTETQLNNILLKTAGGIFSEDIITNFSSDVDKYKDIQMQLTTNVLTNQAYQHILSNEFGSDIYDEKLSLDDIQNFSASTSLEELFKEETNPNNALIDAKNNYEKSTNELNSYIKNIK